LLINDLNQLTLQKDSNLVLTNTSSSPTITIDDNKAIVDSLRNEAEKSVSKKAETALEVEKTKAEKLEVQKLDTAKLEVQDYRSKHSVAQTLQDFKYWSTSTQLEDFLNNIGRTSNEEEVYRLAAIAKTQVYTAHANPDYFIDMKDWLNIPQIYAQTMWQIKDTKNKDAIEFDGWLLDNRVTNNRLRQRLITLTENTKSFDKKLQFCYLVQQARVWARNNILDSKITNEEIDTIEILMQSTLSMKSLYETLEF